MSVIPQCVASQVLPQATTSFIPLPSAICSALADRYSVNSFFVAPCNNKRFMVTLPTEINIHSPDTDVLVLALRRYPELCNDVNFITGTGLQHGVIKLKSAVQALGNLKVAALPDLHALSGANITGSFGGK